MKNKIKIDIGNATSKMIILCWVTIFVCTILKFFGYKEFEIPLFNLYPQYIIRVIINGILFCINGVSFMMLLIKRFLKIKEYIITIIFLIIIFIINLFDALYMLCFILEPLLCFILGCIYTKEPKHKILIETILIYVILVIYQAITSIYKIINPIDVPFMAGIILQIDYYLIIVLTIINLFKKGGYLYERWKTFIHFLPKQKCTKEDVQQNQNDVSQEVGYKIFLIVLSIAQIFLVGTICYFVNNVILEYFIIIVSFFVMRQVFGKSYHADSVLACTTLAVIVFTLATRLTLPQWLSILCNIFIGCMVAYVMYMWYYYAKYTNATGITICKGMSKENLIELSEVYNLTELEYNILCDYYVNRISLENIADRYDYSVDNIKKIKAKALKKLA